MTAVKQDRFPLHPGTAARVVMLACAGGTLRRVFDTIQEAQYHWMMRRMLTKQIIGRMRGLRKQMSLSEKRLWHGLRRKNLGFRFRRQYAIDDSCYLDFYCPEVKVAVEVDGDLHDREKDALRDTQLASIGILTIRIPAGELYPTITPALDRIWRICAERRGPAG